VHNYSEIHFPQDIRNCQTCHKDTTQVNNWLLNPTRESCGSCHDDIDWKSGVNHAAGAQPDDTSCKNCHWPQGEYEYDASISGAHVAPDKSTQLRNPKFEFVAVSNVGPGQSPTVKFKVTDKNGQVIAPATMGGTTYRWYLQEAANTAAFADGVATYTFKGTFPASATGTYAVEAEGYVNSTLNPGTTKQLVYRDAFANVVKAVAVTGTTVEARREVVDLAKCNKCHNKLQLHGNNRNAIEACVVCHNPATTDAGTRPASASPAESIDMKIMIHKIHTGHELANDYTLYGRGGNPAPFNEVGYPGDRRNCLACHKEDTFTVPLASTVTSSTTPRSYWDPMRPTASACLGVESAAHAFLNTASFGEACAVCHKESADFAVTKIHAR
jgi:hypothetical protein